MARKLEVQIVGDASSLQRAFRSAGQSSSSFGSKISGAAKLGAVALGGLAVGSALAGKKMVLLAGDAAEVESKMRVVFGRTLPDLTRNLDSFSKATGTSRFELRQQAADMGALLAPLTASKQGAADMSEQFVKLATDLGSFNNVPTADALLAIRSGLVGESEPLRRFGVLLNEAAVKQEALRLGLVKGKQELTEQQKVQARASLIMKQTALAQGDATRTADSFANQMKRLKSAISDAGTEIGLSLLPAATRLVGFFNEFLQAEGFKAKLKVVWEGVSEVATELFTKVKEAVGAIDWAQVWADAKGLATGLTTALQQVDWAAIGEEIRKGFDRAAEVAGGKTESWASKLTEKIKARDWMQLGEDIGDDIVSGVGSGASQGFDKANSGFTSTMAKLWVNWNAAQIKLAIGLGGSILTGIGNGISRGAGAIGTAFDRVAVGGVTGFAKGLQGLAGAVRDKFNGMLAQLGAYAVLAAGKAYSIGAGIVTGIISGLGGLFTRVGQEIANRVSGAIEWARSHIGSTADEVTAKKIGIPMGEGVIQGWIYSTRDLPEKMSARVKAAIEAGRKAVEAARGRFSSAFSTLASDALAAFDRVRSKMMTPSEKALADFDRKQELQGLQQNLTDAQSELQSARAEGDFDRIIAAEKAVAAAETALWRDALEQQAVQEREKFDDETELKRRHLEERLAGLEEGWAKEGVSAKKAHEVLMKLLASFGIDWKKNGKAMGSALAEGLREAIPEVVAAGSAIANAGRSAMSANPARSFTGDLAGAGGPTVNVYVAGSVTSERDLAVSVRDELVRLGFRNDGTGL